MVDGRRYSGEGSIDGIDTGWSAQGAGRVAIMAIGRHRPHSVVIDHLRHLYIEPH
jgi:hypothetical protein